MAQSNKNSDVSAAFSDDAGCLADGKDLTSEQITAVWVGSFFDELVRWGVHNVVISPGSRSTALAMTAFEFSEQRPDDLHLYVDVDERGAAFFGLGLAKAIGQPVALVCTSGTAVANYYPAVIEAETSRVPLIVLTGDRPPRLQGLGAPQTTDQMKIYGDHVRSFRMMPLPSAQARDVAFVRQAAREAYIAACGGHALSAEIDPQNKNMPASAHDPSENTTRIASCGCAYKAGPVHINFPFDEPLKPDFSGIDAFGAGRNTEIGESDLCRQVIAETNEALSALAKKTLRELLQTHNTLVLAGEGTCSTLSEAREVTAWARAYDLPLLADPLSGLRGINDPLVIDNYDNIFAQDDRPMPDAIIRFGRYPVSKRATVCLGSAHATDNMISVVVDVAQTRDFNSTTDMFVPMAPVDFVRSFMSEGEVADAHADANANTNMPQRDFAQEWIARNDAARERILTVNSASDADQLEGAYIRRILELTPERSCVFSANSMEIRALDTFLVKDDKPLCVLCNRGQNGIDGTVSAALGASLSFLQTTLITGDLALLHDLNALAMQYELTANLADNSDDILQFPRVIIVVFNNNGGAIFDTLPQTSDEPYFERLFLTPQDVDFGQIAHAFKIPYQYAGTVKAFSKAYRAQLGMPGISLIEVSTPLRGVSDRYSPYQE